MSFGRLKIYSDAKEITTANVVDEVSKAYAVHGRNRADIKKLWEYYRGKTRILEKTKEIREEINHKRALSYYRGGNFRTRRTRSTVKGRTAQSGVRNVCGTYAKEDAPRGTLP